MLTCTSPKLSRDVRVVLMARACTLLRGLGLLITLYVGSLACAAQTTRSSLWGYRGPVPSAVAQPRYHYKTLYFQQKIDHFGFWQNGTFSQRYLVGAEHFSTPGSPILFYTGNEGDISWICDNTGFVWEAAEELGALVVFAEHRYYGQSLPFGNSSYSDAKFLQYLSSAQALADYAVLIRHIKRNVAGARKSPVVAVGGSYGGMLAAWLRMKYPQSVVGAIAASAPIWKFSGLTSCGGFAEVTTRTFNLSNPACPASVRRSWAAIDRLAISAGGLRFLEAEFHLCVSLTGLADVLALKAWLAGTWSMVAMVDYPYPASFLQPLPAWPVKAVCAHLTDPTLPDKDLVRHVASAVLVYYNYTGTVPCLNISQTATQSLGVTGWWYQSCTELPMPMCSNGKSDMFEDHPWDQEAFAADCQRQWGVRARFDWPLVFYGGRNITAHSNIVFSNGLLDPWSAGGVLHSPTASLVALVITDGAHHADLRASNPSDPVSFRNVRRAELKAVREWCGHHGTSSLRNQPVSKSWLHTSI
uniref:lysosomal Pro-X carboxypeptidase n=1 Tax=Myxine glutinosa TaxID=7769 RepID=UPI00358FBDB3